MAIDPRRILTGTDGHVWWNGRLIATLTKIEVKMSGDFESISVCGDPADYQLFNGWNGSGSLTYYKEDSAIIDEMIDAYVSGDLPDIQIVTALTNPKTKASARYQISGVAVTEILVTSFESKKQVEDEVPFNFSSIIKLDGIAA